MAVDKYGIDWDEVGDIMRPYRTKDDALSDTELEWRDKIEKEARQQRSLKKRLSARADRPQKQKKKPEKPAEPEKPEETEEPEEPAEPKEPGRPRARANWGPAAAQIVPCAAILLLAPFVSGPARLYLPVLLVTGAPLALAALKLRPQAWLFRLLAPLLPIEAWLALRYGLWNPAGALVPVLLCALVGLLYYLFARRKQAADLPGRQKKGRRILLFVTVLTAASLLAPAALGLGLELRRPRPTRIEALDTQSLSDDALMARRMNSAYERLQPEPWGRAERGDKLAALQALLDVETDSLGIDRFDLRDPMVFTAVSGGGHTSVPKALLSGKEKAETRVRAICHLAYHLMQLSVSQEVNMRRFEDSAGGYENTRYALYAGIWENREAENDHVQ